jgi:hypothetical protein
MTYIILTLVYFTLRTGHGVLLLLLVIIKLRVRRPLLLSYSALSVIILMTLFHNFLLIRKNWNEEEIPKIHRGLLPITKKITGGMFKRRTFSKRN